MKQDKGQELGAGRSTTTPKQKSKLSYQYKMTETLGRHTGTPGTPLLLEINKLFLDTPSKKKPETKELLTFKESPTSETPSVSEPSSNGTCGCTSSGQGTSIDPSNIVQVLKNASGVFGRQDSPFPRRDSILSTRLNFTDGKENWSPSWGPYPTEEELFGTSTSKEDAERQKSADT